jgi:hypothetical protein
LPALDVTDVRPEEGATGTAKIRFFDFATYRVTSLLILPLKKEAMNVTSLFVVNSGPRLASPDPLLKEKAWIPLKGKLIAGPNPSATPAPPK